MGIYEQVEQELDVALAFRERLVPDAVKWFTGEAVDDEEDEDDEDGDDGDEDDEEEEEEDEGPKVKAGKKGGKDAATDAAMAAAFAKTKIGDAAAPAGAAGAPPPAECKQQ